MKKALCLQYDELASKGNFSREDIVTMLTAQVLVKVGEVDLPLRGQKEDFLKS